MTLVGHSPLQHLKTAQQSVTAQGKMSKSVLLSVGWEFRSETTSLTNRIPWVRMVNRQI